ncbi:MAG: c-type cytochrome [Flavobacteriales bacterium]
MAFQNGWRRTRLVLIAAIAMALVVASCEGTKTRDQYPVRASDNGPVDFTLVKKLYDVKCALCHGYDGAQQFAGAKDLTQSVLPKKEVVLRIAEGKATMPTQRCSQRRTNGCPC